MLLNARYRGVYVHGKVKKVRHAGAVSRVRAEASDVITVDIPEWQIVDEETWTKVQELFSPTAKPRNLAGRSAKYALTGIARCGVCEGAVGCASTRQGGAYVKSYACLRRHLRGPRACSASVRQPMAKIEAGLLSYLESHILTPEAIERFARDVRAFIEAQIPDREADIAELEAQLREGKAEQKRLTKAVAIADDVPELVTELRERSTRARSLEVRIATIRRAPEELRSMIDLAEAAARAKLTDIRNEVLQGGELRPLFQRLFPEGLRFLPTREGARQVWEIEGGVDLTRLAEFDEGAFKSASDPKGARPELLHDRPFRFQHLKGIPVENPAISSQIRLVGAERAWRGRRGRPSKTISR
jgi:hypothetical protein